MRTTGRKLTGAALCLLCLSCLWYGLRDPDFLDRANLLVTALVAGVTGLLLLVTRVRLINHSGVIAEVGAAWNNPAYFRGPFEESVLHTITHITFRTGERLRNIRKIRASRRMYERLRPGHEATVSVGRFLLRKWLLSIRYADDVHRENIIYLVLGNATHVGAFGLLWMLIMLVLGTPEQNPQTGVYSYIILLYLVVTVSINIRSWLFPGRLRDGGSG